MSFNQSPAHWRREVEGKVKMPPKILFLTVRSLYPQSSAFRVTSRNSLWNVRSTPSRKKPISPDRRIASFCIALENKGEG